MKLLEDRIRHDGVVKVGGILKVDSFLNHQIDVQLLDEMAAEFVRLFAEKPITKVLTIEASGIAVAMPVARQLKVPLLFAKKSRTLNIDGGVYSTTIESFTHGNTNTVIVSKKFLGPDDCVLIVDDFMANGAAAKGLIDLVEQAGATVAGVGIAIEKGFQPGGQSLRDRGYQVESLAIIEKFLDDGTLEFRAQ